MSNYICNIRCSYRQPSGYCSSTGDYETCQYRQLHSKQSNEPTPIDIRPIHSRIDHYDMDMENGTVSYHVVVTNADKIRAMTDEELANFLMDVASRGGIQTKSGIARWTLIDWLKQEASE